MFSQFNEVLEAYSSNPANHETGVRIYNQLLAQDRSCDNSCSIPPPHLYYIFKHS